jgi:hypothetical protein
MEPQISIDTVIQNLSTAKLKSSKMLLQVLNVIQDLVTIFSNIESEMLKCSDARVENLKEILELINTHAVQVISIINNMCDPFRLLDEASSYLLKSLPELPNLRSKTEFRILASTNQSVENTTIKESLLTLNNDAKSDKLAQLHKMFPKVPSELITLETDKNEMKRLSCAYELLQTEVDYVNDLSVIIDHHKVKLCDYDIDQEDIDVLFSNIQDIMPANKTLLSRLLARKEIDPLLKNVSPSIIDSADSFKVYSLYCANYPRAIKRLTNLQNADPRFKTLLKVILE